MTSMEFGAGTVCTSTFVRVRRYSVTSGWVSGPKAVAMRILDRADWAGEASRQLSPGIKASAAVAISAALLMRRAGRRHQCFMGCPVGFTKLSQAESRLRRLRQVETTVSRQRCYKMSQAVGPLKECA